VKLATGNFYDKGSDLVKFPAPLGFRKSEFKFFGYVSYFNLLLLAKLLEFKSADFIVVCEEGKNFSLFS